MYLDFPHIKKQKIWDGIIGSIHHSDHITIGHITIEAGVVLPEHHHPQEQWTNLLEGIFEITIDGQVQILEAGTSVYIAPNVAHSGRSLTHCKLIDCFHPPREDWKNLPYVE